MLQKNERIGHIGLTDIGHAAIYVCGIFFLLLLSILAIRIVDFEGR